MSWYDSDREDITIYKVVVNHEEQYSIWPADRENPLGWRDVGKVGPKAECLVHIREVWTDMRPLSLRRKMEEAASRQQTQASHDLHPQLTPEPQEDDLVRRLSEKEQPVELSLRPERSGRAFKERIDRGYILIKFTQTKPGTELNVKLDSNATNLSEADWSNQSGSVHLEGDLILNYVKVRCIADIDVATLAGQGYLQAAQQ